MAYTIDFDDLTSFYSGKREEEPTNASSFGVNAVEDASDSSINEQTEEHGNEDDPTEFDLSRVLTAKTPGEKKPEINSTSTYTGPVVVEFKDPLSGIIGLSREGERSFKSSSIKRLKSTETRQKVSTSTAMNAEEMNERALDEELKKLTRTHLEQFAVEQLEGRDRRRYLVNKLEELCPKKQVFKTREAAKPRVPLKIANGMMKVSRERALKAQKQLEQAGDDIIVASSTTNKHVGMSFKKSSSALSRPDVVFSSRSHPLLQQAERKQKHNNVKRVLGGNRREDRGLGMGIGKFKQGKLHIRDWEIAQVTQSSAPKKSNSKAGNRKRKR